MAAVNFTPLKHLFLQCYSAAHVHVPANPSLPPLALHVRRNPETTEMREVLPFVSFDLEDVKAEELADANRYFGRGKFVEALTTYRGVVQKLLLVVASGQGQATEVSQIRNLRFGRHVEQQMTFRSRS